MKVLWLGAGSSHKAGYPLGAMLIESVEAHVSTVGVDATTRQQWEDFIAYRKNATGPAKAILNSQNPEVVLSYLDLCAEALSASERTIEENQRRVIQEIKKVPPTPATVLCTQKSGYSLKSMYDELEASPFVSAVKARSGFLAGLNAYFGWMHAKDNENDGARIDYIRQELDFLADADAVITTNYDTLIERTLLAQGRWVPSDGYGFDVPLSCTPPDSLHEAPIPKWVARASKIRVLKLHGSYGWRLQDRVQSLDEDNMVLESSLFHFMYPQYGSDIAVFYDQRESRSQYPITTPLLLYPSFLKQLDGIAIQKVWEHARIALENATNIRIVGASLPVADSAARALLNRVRFRVAEGLVEVDVHDHDETIVSRWRRHLGQNLVWTKRYAGEDLQSEKL